MVKKKEIYENMIEKWLDKLEFNLGTTCFKIKKLTDKYVIFKSCFNGDEVKHYFTLDEPDFEERVLPYLLKKHKNTHFSINRNISFWRKRKKPKKPTLKELKEFIDKLGVVWHSDIMEYFEISHKECYELTKDLKSKGEKIK